MRVFNQTVKCSQAQDEVGLKDIEEICIDVSSSPTDPEQLRFRAF